MLFNEKKATEKLIFSSHTNINGNTNPFSENNSVLSNYTLNLLA